MKTLAIIKGTFYEFRHSTGFIVFLCFLGCAILVFGLVLGVSEGDQLTLFGQEIQGMTLPAGANLSATDMIFIMIAGIPLSLYAIVMFIFATGGKLPAMLSRGLAELYLSRPVARWHLILSKYLSIILFGTVLAAVTVISLASVIFLKTGHFNTIVIESVLLGSFSYAVLLTIVFFFNIAFGRSTFLAGVLAFVIWMTSTLVSQLEQFMDSVVEVEVVKKAFHIVHIVLPKFGEMGRHIQRDIPQVQVLESVDMFFVVWSSALFGAVLLAAAVLLFNRKEY